MEHSRKLQNDIIGEACIRCTYPITLRNVQNVLVLNLQTKSLLVCLELQSTQRFEVIAIDLSGPLPQTDSASARQCATTLIEEVFMRHGIPRRIISDNGTQLVSDVVQQICFTLNISQNLIPVYSPLSNPVERKNRDLKPRIAILVGEDHSNWHSKLPVICFTMNTTVCDTTGHTPAYLLFGRELRTIDDVVQDFKNVVHNDNFVAEITPYLKRFATITETIRERKETEQDQRKKQYDKNRRPVYYSPGDKKLLFQQDGATCPTARATIDLLKDTFGDRLISRFGPVNWPPRSCDLTRLDYFLWGYVKSLVYADKPQTLDHLEDNIRRVIADIRSQMLEKVIENWTSRLDCIRASRGSPMPGIIFKM
ncbi:gag-Pol polyprotein [Trichonephila clavipes]|nr:gag-Pol polyprotein [Trichonephila clavipes]